MYIVEVVAFTELPQPLINGAKYIQRGSKACEHATENR